MSINGLESSENIKQLLDAANAAKINPVKFISTILAIDVVKEFISRETGGSPANMDGTALKVSVRQIAEEIQEFLTK